VVPRVIYLYSHLMCIKIVCTGEKAWQNRVFPLFIYLYDTHCIWKKEVNRLCVLGFESFAFLIQIRFLLVTGSSNYYASFDVFIFILHDSTNYMKYISIHTYIYISVFIFFYDIKCTHTCEYIINMDQFIFESKTFFLKKKSAMLTFI